MKVELRMFRIAVLVCIVSVCGFAVPARAHVCYPPCNSSECKSCSADNTCELDCDDWDDCEDCVDGNCPSRCTGDCETCDNSFCEEDEGKCPGECENCSDGNCTNFEALCHDCEDCDPNGDCVDNGTTCEGCKTCNDAGNCEDNDEECYGCETCIGGDCLDDDDNCTGCESCYSGACVDNNGNCVGCESCKHAVCVDDSNNCTGCESCSDAVCGYDVENESMWSWYYASSGEVPSDCLPVNCDGEDSTDVDDCGNELEVSCCQSDGTGGISGCAFRYFYNDGLISSCIWSYTPENYFYCKEATVVGTTQKVFTKLKHINISTAKYLEGCWGYYCTKIVIYDIIEGGDPEIYWRRDPDDGPEDIDEGIECPGH